MERLSETCVSIVAATTVTQAQRIAASTASRLTQQQRPVTQAQRIEQLCTNNNGDMMWEHNHNLQQPCSKLTLVFFWCHSRSDACWDCWKLHAYKWTMHASHSTNMMAGDWRKRSTSIDATTNIMAGDWGKRSVSKTQPPRWRKRSVSIDATTMVTQA